MTAVVSKSRNNAFVETGSVISNSPRQFSHIWYFKGIPSRIGTFCELSSRDVERVLYFEGFIVVEVTDPDCPLEPGQVLTEIEYIEHSNKYWGGFRAGEPVRKLFAKF